VNNGRRELDLPVNNVGIVRDRMVPNMSDEDWDAVLQPGGNGPGGGGFTTARLHP